MSYLHTTVKWKHLASQIHTWNKKKKVINIVKMLVKYL